MFDNLNRINSIIIQWPCNGYSGTVFLESVFDFHTNLLTVPLHGMADFMHIYKNVLYNKSVIDFINNFNSSEDPSIQYFIKFLFNDCHIDIDLFYSKIFSIFQSNNYKPTKTEWFKSFYLAYNMCFRNNDNLLQSSIYFSMHPLIKPIPFNSLYDIFYDFKNIKGLTIVRRPSIALASFVDQKIYLDKVKHLTYASIMNTFCFRLRNILGEFNYNSSTYIMPVFSDKNTEFFKSKYIVRFEDLKEQPYYFLKKLCNVLEIDFDDILLKTTINGKPYTMSLRGPSSSCSDFSPHNIFDLHSSAFSDFDHYRIELLTAELYSSYNYNTLFYSNNHCFSQDDIIKLFEIPFKFESFFIRDESRSEIISIRNLLLSTVKFIVSKSPFITSSGCSLSPFKLIQ